MSLLDAEAADCFPRLREERMRYGAHLELNRSLEMVTLGKDFVDRTWSFPCESNTTSLEVNLTRPRQMITENTKPSLPRLDLKQGVRTSFKGANREYFRCDGRSPTGLLLCDGVAVQAVDPVVSTGKQNWYCC